MANFQIAEQITGRNEGGYANDPADRGGETYAGIARNFWPNWPGWKTIDEIKRTKGRTAAIINANARVNRELQEQISLFYQQNFWNVNRLDQFQDQQIANTVYDFGVNAGAGKAAQVLQDILGVTQDGKIGPVTLTRLHEGNPKAVHTAYNCKREAYYRKLAEKPSQAKFLKSWLSRLKPYTP